MIYGLILLVALALIVVLVNGPKGPPPAGPKPPVLTWM